MKSLYGRPTSLSAVHRLYINITLEELENVQNLLIGAGPTGT